MLNRAVPVLRYLERFIRPRWQTPFETTKRVVGGANLLVGTLLFAPIPLSNVPPALVIILLSFAYLEAYHSALPSPPHSSCQITGGAIWQAMGAAGWAGGLL
jgi:Exopolysaccharide synthesis, ExoD